MTYFCGSALTIVRTIVIVAETDARLQMLREVVLSEYKAVSLTTALCRLRWASIGSLSLSRPEAEELPFNCDSMVLACRLPRDLRLSP